MLFLSLSFALVEFNSYIKIQLTHFIKKNKKLLLSYYIPLLSYHLVSNATKKIEEEEKCVYHSMSDLREFYE